MKSVLHSRYFDICMISIYLLSVIYILILNIYFYCLEWREDGKEEWSHQSYFTFIFLHPPPFKYIYDPMEYIPILIMYFYVKEYCIEKCILVKYVRLCMWSTSINETR